MSKLTIGDIPIAIRLKSVGAMTGVQNIGPDPDNNVYEPDRFVKGRFDMVDPANTTLDVLKDGGLLQFDEGNISLTEVRVFLASTKTISLAVQDDDGSNSVDILLTQDGQSKQYVFDPPIQVLPGQRVQIKTTAAGIVDVYVRRPFKI